MFYCRGMNFADLVKIKVKDIQGNRLHYGRSKTGSTFSIKITHDLQFILNHYLDDKKQEDLLYFPLITTDPLKAMRSIKHSGEE